MYLLGWNWDQWEYALYRFNTEDIETKKDVLNIRRKWDQKYRYNPLEIQLENIEYARDYKYDLVYKIFMLRW